MLEVLFFFALVQEILRSAGDSRFNGSVFDAGCTRGLSSSSSETAVRSGQTKQEVYHLHLRPDLVCELDMLIVAPTEQKLHVSSGDQIAHVRKTREVQHNVSHCGVLSWRRVQAKSWTCNFVSLWIQFNSRTQIFHLVKGEQDGEHHLSQARQLWWNMEVLLESE